MNAKLFFKSKLKDEYIFVEAEEERLTQVIDNILDNAFKLLALTEVSQLH